MNTFNLVVSGAMTVILVAGIYFSIKQKYYKYLGSLALLLVAIILMVLATLPNLSGDFKGLILTLFGITFFIVSGIMAGITYIIRSLKKNK